MSNKNSLLEQKDTTKALVKTDENQDKSLTFVPVKQKNTDVISIFTLLATIFITIVLVIFSIFTIFNIFNTNIISGISIKGINVSGLSPSDAKYQVDNFDCLKRGRGIGLGMRMGEFHFLMFQF